MSRIFALCAPRMTPVVVILMGLVVGAACVQEISGKFVAFPDFSGLTQDYATFVDEGNDGTNEASDSGSIVAGASNPGVLSTSTSTHSVSLSAENDFDSLLAHCEHTISPGTSETGCAGIIRGRFVPTTEGNALFHVQVLEVPGETALPSGLTIALSAEVFIDCGPQSSTVLVDLDFGTAPLPQKAVYLNIDPANDCFVSIDLLAANIATPGLAAPLNVVQTVSVSVSTPTLPDCTRSSQCPAENPICGADGRCGKGDEGQSASVALVHCQTPFVSTSGCSHGVSGSICRGDFECDSGYSCNGLGICEGDISCGNDTDCTPAAPICTEQGTCSSRGEQGEACLTGDFCRESLICLSNHCTVRLGQGGDCSQDFTVCDGGLTCLASTDTCETPLTVGSSCLVNSDCADFPTLNTCNQATGGVCAVRQTSGGPCAQNLDCQGFGGCDLGTNLCN